MSLLQFYLLNLVALCGIWGETSLSPLGVPPHEGVHT